MVLQRSIICDGRCRQANCAETRLSLFPLEFLIKVRIRVVGEALINDSIQVLVCRLLSLCRHSKLVNKAHLLILKLADLTLILALHHRLFLLPCLKVCWGDLLLTMPSSKPYHLHLLLRFPPQYQLLQLHFPLALDFVLLELIYYLFRFICCLCGHFIRHKLLQAS